MCFVLTSAAAGRKAKAEDPTLHVRKVQCDPSPSCSSVPFILDANFVEFNKIAFNNWPKQFPYSPDVEFRIAHTGTSILLQFRGQGKGHPCAPNPRQRLTSGKTPAWSSSSPPTATTTTTTSSATEPDTSGSPGGRKVRQLEAEREAGCGLPRIKRMEFAWRRAFRREGKEMLRGRSWR